MYWDWKMTYLFEHKQVCKSNDPGVVYGFSLEQVSLIRLLYNSLYLHLTPVLLRHL